MIRNTIRRGLLSLAPFAMLAALGGCAGSTDSEEQSAVQVRVSSCQEPKADSKTEPNEERSRGNASATSLENLEPCSDVTPKRSTNEEQPGNEMGPD